MPRAFSEEDSVWLSAGSEERPGVRESERGEGAAERPGSLETAESPAADDFPCRAGKAAVGVGMGCWRLPGRRPICTSIIAV